MMPDNADGLEPQARSGDHSRDARFDPDGLFRIISASDSAEQIAAAMATFLDRGNESQFAEAIAVYVRSARARGEPVERVLATLNTVAARFDPTSKSHLGGELRLRELMIRGLLVGAYGDVEVSTSDTEGRAHHEGSQRSR